MVKALMKSLVSEEVLRSGRLGYRLIQAKTHNFAAQPPILIYAMPKVGTSTVDTTLREAGFPVFKVHRLSYEGIQASENHLREIQRLKFFNIYKIAREVRRKIDRNPKNEWKIITLTREPISQAISGLFQGIEFIHPGLMKSNGQVDIDAVYQHLSDRFASYSPASLSDDAWYALSWFDRELKSVFGIDIYEHPYRHDQGFSIVRDKNVEVLVIRMEDLNRGFDTAITSFLNLGKAPHLKRENDGREKKTNAAYNQVKNNICIPEDICRSIYSSRYAMHFYTETEREKLIQKWSRAQVKEASI